jgi:hypothetical protein
MKQPILLAGIMLVGLTLQSAGCRMELPYAPHRDERFFVDRAVKMAASGDLNPHWFGHPGSPTIYSLALLYHVRHLAHHGGHWFQGNPALAEAFAANPAGFYLLARRWQILFACLSILLVYLFVRRLFDAPTGLVAAWLLATNPQVAVMAKFARTDGTSLFLASLVALAMVRAMKSPSRRGQLLAGALLGLAAANKYYLCVYGAALPWLAPSGSRGWQRLSAPALALSSAALGFAAAVPFLILDVIAGWSTLRPELLPFDGLDAFARAARPDLAPWYWYFTGAVPRLLGWLECCVALGGALLLVKARDRAGGLLLLVPFCFLAVCGVPGLRKTYWLIAIMPLFAAVAAHALRKGEQSLAQRFAGARWRVLLLPILAVLVALPSLWLAAARVRVLAGPAPRYLARQWIFTHAAADSLVIQESDNAPWMTLPPGGFINGSFVAHDGHSRVRVQVVQRLSEGGATLEGYRCQGVRYLMVNQSRVEGLSADGEPAAFYRVLAQRARLMAEFPMSGPRFDPAQTERYEHGDVYLPTVRIYDIGDLACARS